MILAVGVAILCGAYLGVAWERYRRPHGKPPIPVSDQRMARLHVIDGNQR